MSEGIQVEFDEDYSRVLRELGQALGIQTPSAVLRHLVRKAQAEEFPAFAALPKFLDTQEPLPRAREDAQQVGPTGRDPRQYLVLRKDLKVHKGKMVAQGAHASWGALLQSATVDTARRTVTLHLNEPGWGWLVADRFKKIVLAVPGEAELLALHAAAQARGLPCCLIQDAGFTEFNGVLTYTALAIGPVWPHQVDGLTSCLPMY